MDASKYGDFQSVDIDWLESVPKHWVPKRLRFVINSNPVKSEVSDLEKDTIVSFVPMESVTDNGQMYLEQEKNIEDVYSGYTFFKDEDIVLAKITPCFENGKGAIASGLTNGIGFGTTEFHVLRASEELDNRWLYYLTKSHPFLEIGTAEMFGAGGQKRVPESYIKNFRLGIPPKREQIQIAHFLDYKTTQIDRLITKKKSLIEKLNEQRIVVITQTVTKGLNPDVQVKDSEVEWLGRVPRHWKIKRLRFLSEGIEQGWSPQCDSQPAEENEWGVLKVGCVNGNNLDTTENKALPISLEPKFNYEIQPGEILISRANTKELVGSAAIVPADVRKKLILCDKLYRLEPADEIDSRYLLFILRSPLSRYQYEREATGASGSMQNIGQDIIRNLLVTLPPLDEQQDIVEFLSGKLKKIDDMVAINQQTIEKLEEYRTALITAAVTGKIDVRNVEMPDQDAA